MLILDGSKRPMKISPGFSLVELMVTIAVFGVLIAAAAPSVGTMILDAQTRTVAESLQNALRLAQAEAVKRSRQVEFFLTNATPSMGAAPSTTGKNWGIQELSLTNLATPVELIQGDSFAGSSGNVALVASSGTLRFNSMGRVTNPAAAVTFDLSNPSASGTRSYRVLVTLSGAIRMCDPSKTRNATNPDGC